MFIDPVCMSSPPPLRPARFIHSGMHKGAPWCSPFLSAQSLVLHCHGTEGTTFQMAFGCIPDDRAMIWSTTKTMHAQAHLCNQIFHRHKRSAAPRQTQQWVLCFKVFAKSAELQYGSSASHMILSSVSTTYFSKRACTGNRAQVTNMVGLYDATTLCVPEHFPDRCSMEGMLLA